MSSARIRFKTACSVTCSVSASGAMAAKMRDRAAAGESEFGSESSWQQVSLVIDVLDMYDSQLNFRRHGGMWIKNMFADKGRYGLRIIQIKQGQLRRYMFRIICRNGNDGTILRK